MADTVRAAARRHGLPTEKLVALGCCESGLSQFARNSSGASGLMQFMPSTYRAHGGRDLWDPAEQAEVAALMISQGGLGAWSCAWAYYSG